MKQSRLGNLYQRPRPAPQFLLDQVETQKYQVTFCVRGVISPVLSNLFLHYVFDRWMERNHPQHPWARYADDAVTHCRTRENAENLLKQLHERFNECGLELHPDKTKIVYCKDDDRRAEHQEIKFDFLGYTFRPRRSKNRHGKFFINFTPGVSNKAAKAMRHKIRNWRMGILPSVG